MCISFWIHVSFVYNIVHHCSQLQLRCSWAQASCNSLFFSEIEDLWQAIHLWNPACLKTDVIDHSDASLHVHIEYSRDNCVQERQQLWQVAQTKMMSSWSWSSLIKRDQPEHFLYTQLDYWDAKTLEIWDNQYLNVEWLFWTRYSTWKDDTSWKSFAIAS